MNNLQSVSIVAAFPIAAVMVLIVIFSSAACLLGAAAGGAGILVMTEADLYQKSPEEAYQETLKNYA